MDQNAIIDRENKLSPKKTILLWYLIVIDVSILRESPMEIPCVQMWLKGSNHDFMLRVTIFFLAINSDIALIFKKKYLAKCYYGSAHSLVDSDRIRGSYKITFCWFFYS